MSALSAFCSISLEIAASVVTKLSMVHIFGWIMPEPLHMPPSVTSLPPSVNCTAISFFTVSVVMIAFAASVPFSREPSFVSASTFTPALMRSIGSCIPMTPVEPTSTASFAMPSASAAASAVSRQY